MALYHRRPFLFTFFPARGTKAWLVLYPVSVLFQFQGERESHMQSTMCSRLMRPPFCQLPHLRSSLLCLLFIIFSSVLTSFLGFEYNKNLVVGGCPCSCIRSTAEPPLNSPVFLLPLPQNENPIYSFA